MAKVFLALLLGASLLQAVAFEKVVKAKTTEVAISSEKPLTTGNNTLKIAIADAKYADAAVRVKVFMPAMPGMPYMESEVDAKNLNGGKYEANVNLSMGGTWQVHIFIMPKTGKKTRVKTSINI